jgi:hypothetical protein
MNFGVIASWSPPARGQHSGRGASRPVLALHRGGPGFFAPLNSPCMECAHIGTTDRTMRLMRVRPVLKIVVEALKNWVGCRRAIPA